MPVESGKVQILVFIKEAGFIKHELSKSMRGILKALGNQKP